MTNEDAISALEKIEPADTEAADALDGAADALAFAQTIWKQLTDQGFVKEGNNVVDYSLMENILDGLQGELAAVCLYLAEVDPGIITNNMRAIADKLEQTAKGEVPIVVARGYRRVAGRIENTKKAVEAAKKLLEAAKGLDTAE